MNENAHIVVSRQGRALILDNDGFKIRSFNDIEGLLALAHEYSDPPIVIDIGGSWGWALMNSASTRGYHNISRTTD